VLDEQVQANLDQMIEMVAQADLFVVITFRTGPGRSDFTFYRDGAGDWFDADLLIENVWTDQDAQDAWVEMWRYTAEHYRDNPVVVGYDLMCEPNSSGVAFEIYEPRISTPNTPTLPMIGISSTRASLTASAKWIRRPRSWSVVMDGAACAGCHI